MKLRNKIGTGILVFFAIAITSLGLVLSHNSACIPAPATSEGAELMKAIVYRCYGSTDVLRLENIEKPKPSDDEVLVKIHAASVNPLDWHYMRGTPYLVRLGSGIGAPTNTSLGVDFSGTIEAIGESVTLFKPGDEVFGGRTGAFAEYVTVREGGALALKPANISFEQAASVQVAAITALQALRDNADVQPGQKVLINGASGGVGTFAVQIAKSYGAEVTGVCSTRNLEMVQSLGADHVIDYTQDDYTESGQSFDIIVDMVGNHSLLTNRTVMAPDGKFVIVGGATGNWIGALIAPIKALFLSPFVGQEFGMMLAQPNHDDLVVLADLMQAGKLTPVIDRRYKLSEVPAALEYSEEGHARGKIIISLE